MAEAAQQIVEAGNTRLDAVAAAKQGQALLTAITGVETVEQGSAAAALAQIGADPNLATTLVAQFTGAPLVDAASVTAAPITDAPRLAAGSDGGLSATDTITADLSPTFTGTALPGTFVTLLEFVSSGFATGAVTQGEVLGSTQADSSGH